MQMYLFCVIQLTTRTLLSLQQSSRWIGCLLCFWTVL